MRELIMSYMKCITEAGAEVLDYKYFGSYQGTILAFVKEDGKTKWLDIGYGSCSACDGLQAFEERFDWDEKIPAEEYARFGRDLLECTFQSQQLIERLEKQAEWDYEAQEMIDFIKEVEAEHT